MRTSNLTSARTGQTIKLAMRVVMATVLFYAVAVLYAGTAGAAGMDVFVQPMIGTAVFGGVLVLPLAAAWVVSRRLTDSGNAG
ncbi:hypothetical protein [Gordonia phthalatica]|uniref:Uncharacterized protein n=1 Tax=Gordonia phthalatica TaxID=1136941 RepID=A0A0N9N6P1_9ACTN|nr:hypothetical protein [Gordonia phthalatica]ALG83526.1 hypothetical protein ACH46_02135 [Gordonia phthalatica]